jgi:hypothetical protein
MGVRVCKAPTLLFFQNPSLGQEGSVLRFFCSFFGSGDGVACGREMQKRDRP